MSHSLTLQSRQGVTHDTHRYVFDRPEDFEFEPGQAAEPAMRRDGWTDEGRPFTFTPLPGDNALEFTIKSYPSHDGVTERLPGLKVDHVLSDEAVPGLHHGRVDAGFLKDHADPSGQVCIRGPQGYVDAMREAVRELGIPGDRIHAEEGWQALAIRRDPSRAARILAGCRRPAGRGGHRTGALQSHSLNCDIRIATLGTGPAPGRIGAQ